jgi:steroid delta-isomerase-like uncharacterized protein
MPQDPKTVVLRLENDVWNRGDAAAAEELLAEDVVWHHPTLGELRGRASFLEAIAEIRAAYPDFTVVLEKVVAEGDTVMAHWVATGTHRNAYHGAAPTGQQVTWRGSLSDRVVDGQVVERHTFPDTMTPGGPHEILSRQARG